MLVAKQYAETAKRQAETAVKAEADAGETASAHLDKHKQPGTHAHRTCCSRPAPNGSWEYRRNPGRGAHPRHCGSCPTALAPRRPDLHAESSMLPIWRSSLLVALLLALLLEVLLAVRRALRVLQP